MQESSFEIICHILKHQCECHAEITEESRLMEDLKLESMALLILITELENHYQQAFDLNEGADIQTIGDIVHLIQERELVDE